MRLLTAIIVVLSSVAAIFCVYNGSWISGLILGIVAWICAFVHLETP
jgi:uncharacterized membrane protein YgaE (UPF0421/DUF939 family)